MIEYPIKGSLDYPIRKYIPKQKSMKDIVSSCCFDLDATISASYSGTGQTWANLVASPNDGANQTDYDFWLGADNTATTNDPTFNGTAGDSGAFWSFDGGDWFTLKSIPTAFNDILKPTGKSTFFVVFKTGSTVGWQAIFDTRHGSNAYNGISIFLNGSNNIYMALSTSAGYALLTSSAALSINTIYSLAVIFDNSSSFSIHINNMNTADATVSTTVGSTATHSFNAGIGAYDNGTFPFYSGTELYGISFFNSALSTTELKAVKNEYSSRHNRTY